MHCVHYRQTLRPLIDAGACCAPTGMGCDGLSMRAVHEPPLRSLGTIAMIDAGVGDAIRCGGSRTAPTGMGCDAYRCGRFTNRPYVH